MGCDWQKAAPVSYYMCLFVWSWMGVKEPKRFIKTSLLSSMMVQKVKITAGLISDLTTQHNFLYASCDQNKKGIFFSGIKRWSCFVIPQWYCILLLIYKGHRGRASLVQHQHPSFSEMDCWHHQHLKPKDPHIFPRTLYLFMTFTCLSCEGPTSASCRESPCFITR